jgi:hypothetical protein
VTTDGGTNWNLRTAGLTLGRVRRILPDPANSDHAFCVIERRVAGRVFETTDAGVHWNDVTGDLPQGLITLCMAADWRASTPASLRRNRPRGVRLVPTTDDLASRRHRPAEHDRLRPADRPRQRLAVAGTHGRGMWRAHTDVIAPAVAVVSPNGGNSLLIGASTNLDWTASDDVTLTTVDLELSRNGVDGPWETIASDLPNSGSYVWTVTGPTTLDARLRVRARDNSDNFAEDLSDASFAITDGPTAVEPAGRRRRWHWRRSRRIRHGDARASTTCCRPAATRVSACTTSRDANWRCWPAASTPRGRTR